MISSYVHKVPIHLMAGSKDSPNICRPWIFTISLSIINLALMSWLILKKQIYDIKIHWEEKYLHLQEQCLLYHSLIPKVSAQDLGKFLLDDKSAQKHERDDNVDIVSNKYFDNIHTKHFRNANITTLKESFSQSDFVDVHYWRVMHCTCIMLDRGYILSSIVLL